MGTCRMLPQRDSITREMTPPDHGYMLFALESLARIDLGSGGFVFHYMSLIRLLLSLSLEFERHRVPYLLQPHTPPF